MHNMYIVEFCILLGVKSQLDQLSRVTYLGIVELCIICI